MDTSSPASQACPVCHQAVLPQYYFCPNCGANLHPAPLPTDAGTQTKLYLFSVVLPMMLFLFITKWQGLKYFRSEDPKAKQIGSAAIVVLVLSTVITFGLAYVETTNAIQQATDQINAQMSF